MLTRATFTNFKALKDVAVDLTPFTVIVGKNGSGKTSVLQGIDNILRVVHRQPTIFAGINTRLRWLTRPRSGPLRIAVSDESDRTFALEIHAETGEDGKERGRLAASLSGHQPETVDLSSPSPGRFAHQHRLEATQRAESQRAFLGSAERQFGSAVFMRLDARVMVRGSVASTEEPKLGFDGEGLATVLNSMAGAMPDVLDEIRRDLSAVVPHVRGIRTFPTKIRRPRREHITIDDQDVVRDFEEEVAGYRFALDMGAGRLIEADLLSEGTVLALGLLTALRHPQCPRLVLLDDVDAALHSSAQAELVRAIRAILAARPELQIICTSHSPDLLDNVSFEEIRVMALDREGYAHCGRLSDHPESEKWRKMLRTGEFWASVGEDWLLAGPADGQ